MSEDTFYEDLAIAMLAVNSLPVDKVYPLRDDLRAQGLFTPDTVVKWDHATACQQLKAAGYDRGPYYGSILASRLQELALAANGGALNAAREALKADRPEEVDTALLKIHGVGPVVVRNFWILQGREDNR